MSFESKDECDRLDRCMSVMNDAARAAGFSRDEVIEAVCILRNGALVNHREFVEKVEEELQFSSMLMRRLNEALKPGEAEKK